MKDHIPDVTKMLDETPCKATPREELRNQIMSSIIPKNEREWWAKRTIEQLERELNALTKERDIESERATHYRDKWQSAETRIKRLEEAGDALEYASVVLEAGEDPNGFEKLLLAQREWREAKEAKP